MAKLLMLLAFWLPASVIAQPAVVWTTNYYPVGGATLRAIHQSLRYHRPWKSTSEHDGYTGWKVEWTFSLVPSGNTCRLGSMTTRTTITTTLPRWTAPTNVTEEVRTAWNHYITALGQHEAGHAQFAFAAAAEMQKAARESPNDVNCPALKQKINNLCQNILEQYRAKEREYDERTRHGATQGAVLSRRLRERPDRSN